VKKTGALRPKNDAENKSQSCTSHVEFDSFPCSWGREKGAVFGIFDKTRRKGPGKGRIIAPNLRDGGQGYTAHNIEGRHNSM